MTCKKYTVTTWFHPGETLKELLEERNLSSGKFAQMCGLPEEAINDFINGKTSVSKAFAEILEKNTKMPAKMWLGLQKGYDTYLAKNTKTRPWSAAAL